MGWTYLIIAIILEVAAALCLKYSDSLSKLWPSILLFVFYALCFLAMIKALQYLQLGAMYAIWGGLGTALVAIFSWLLFHDPMTALKVAGIALIVTGVFLTNLSGINNPDAPGDSDSAEVQPVPATGDPGPPA